MLRQGGLAVGPEAGGEAGGDTQSASAVSVVWIGVILARIASVGWQAVAGSQADVGEKRASFLRAAVSSTVSRMLQKV
jgi:hypothetical protein